MELLNSHIGAAAGRQFLRLPRKRSRACKPPATVAAWPGLSVSATCSASGFRSIICNRPDDEERGQPSAVAVAAAADALGLRFIHIPVVAGTIDEGDAAAMTRALAELPGPVLAYCRSGARSEQLATMAAARGEDGGIARYDIVVIGGGSAGIAVAASILRRRPDASLAIVEPSEDHYYQPGWTMVGAGVFAPEVTRRDEAGLIPAGAEWIRAAAASFDPANNGVTLADGRVRRACGRCGRRGLRRGDRRRRGRGDGALPT